MNNIEELKKAALGANLHGWTGFEDALNDDGYSEAVSKFIGHCRPSEILALIAQLEAAQKELFDFHNQEFQQRLANAEHQLYMKDLAIHNIKASRKAQFRKRLAAEAELSAANEKLSKPVVLPPRRSASYFVDEEFSNEDLAAIYNAARLEFSVKVKNAGFTVEGNADAE